VDLSSEDKDEDVGRDVVIREPSDKVREQLQRSFRLQGCDCDGNNVPYRR
jgi:hypothetical protein